MDQTAYPQDADRREFLFWRLRRAASLIANFDDEPFLGPPKPPS